MDFPDASRFAGDRDVVLVGYRGVDGSSVLDCPEAESAMKHARDLLGKAYYDAYGKGLSDCAKRLRGERRRPRRLLAARARRRSRGRAPRPRLPPDRPAQRERGHAHGADLRLALSEEHPPLGAGRRQPAGQLPLVPADHRRAGPQVRRALRARRRLQRAHERPRRDDPPRLADDPGPLGLPADQARQRADRRLLRPVPRDERRPRRSPARRRSTRGCPPPRATRAGCGCCR